MKKLALLFAVVLVSAMNYSCTKDETNENEIEILSPDKTNPLPGGGD